MFSYEQEWRKMTERVGFWIDMDDPYITYHDTYIESVWWALKRIWEKGLLYKGNKVVPYCPLRASFQVTKWHKDIRRSWTIGFAKFPVVGEENTYFLVWTTTPWTLPSNVALAVKDDYTYVKVEHKGENSYWPKVD